MAKKNKSKLKWLLLFLLTGLIILFLYANKIVKKNGYKSIVEVVQIYFNQKQLAKNSNVKQLNIELSSTDYQFIKEKREIALNRGLQINEGDNYVPCQLTLDNKKIDAEIRLKGHMTDHLEGEKWSFRIKSKDTIMDMYRFSIQHPGTRNYVYEWIYHQLLKEEGVIYLNYDFINVNLNGNSLGIYAVEEHFGQHVLSRNNRPKGAILRWNPKLYWEWRIDEFQDVYLDEEYSHYSSSFAEPYDKGVIKGDKDLIDNYQMGSYLLEEFKRGKLKTSEVFDVERMARFHVIIDLVGGYHSLDWSDVKFYYNNLTKKIEPVGYESFSIRETKRIAGQRIPKSYDKSKFNYHDQLFDDPVFFEAYIKNLERIVDEKYLNEFFNKVEPKLKHKIAIIANEWAYRKFSLEGYYKNVRLIRNNINLPKPFHAFIENDKNNKLLISLAPVSDFPIQIIGVKRKDRVVDLKNVIVLPAKARKSHTHYLSYEISNPFKKSTNISLLAKIPGGTKVFEIELNEYPAYKNAVIMNQDSLKLTIDTALMNVSGNRISFRKKRIKLNKHLIIPKEYSLNIFPGQEIIIGDEVEVKVSGKINFHGTNEQQITIKSLGKSIIKLHDGSLTSSFTTFSNGIIIHSLKSDLEFKNCLIYDLDDKFIEDYQSTIVFYKSSAGRLKQLGLFNESDLVIEESNFTKGRRLIESNGSFISIIDSNISNFNNVASLNYSSEFYSWRSSFKHNDTISTLAKSSNLNIYSSKIVDSNVAVVKIQDSRFHGNSSFKLYKCIMEDLKTKEISI